jgi:hypothetical protein
MVEEVKTEYKPADTEQWHGTFREGIWTVTGLITGCGLMQISGLEHACNPQAAAALKKLKKRLEKDASSPQWLKGRSGFGSPKPLKCRTLIGTLGSYYYGDIHVHIHVRIYGDILGALKDLGFECLCVYPNASHIGLGFDESKSQQKLFMLQW